MPMDNIKIYKTLKDRLGEQETEDLLQYIDEKVTTSVATKEDILRLEGKIELVRTELAGNMLNVKTELGGKIGALDGKIDLVKTELVGSLTNLEGKFRLYFASLAGLVVLTNPKVLDLFGKLLGLVK